MRLLVTAVAAALALTLAACSHDTELKETPQQIAQEQAAADAHNRDTVPSPADDETPQTTELVTNNDPFVTGADRLFAGDCVDRPTGNGVAVHDVSCSAQHHAEVTARVDIGPRFVGVYPTLQQLGDVRDTDCLRTFEAYVGHPPTPDLVPDVYGPSTDEWSQPSQRDAVCLAAAPQDKGNVLVGSVRKKE